MMVVNCNKIQIRILYLYLVSIKKQMINTITVFNMCSNWSKYTNYLLLYNMNCFCNQERFQPKRNLLCGKEASYIPMHLFVRICNVLIINSILSFALDNDFVKSHCNVRKLLCTYSPLKHDYIP